MLTEGDEVLLEGTILKEGEILERPVVIFDHFVFFKPSKISFISEIYDGPRLPTYEEFKGIHPFVRGKAWYFDVEYNGRKTAYCSTSKDDCEQARKTLLKVAPYQGKICLN